MSCAVTPDTRNREEVTKNQNTTYLDDFALKAPSGVLATWITYSLGRTIYRDNRYFKMNPGSAVYRYTFSEELFARDMMCRVWPEHKRNSPGLSDDYLDTLRYILDSGFLPEYVWCFFWVPEWGNPTESLRLREFSEWQKTHLKDHRAETHAFVSKTDITTAVDSQEIDTKSACALLENGVKELQRGNPDKAISSYFDPVIKQYEAKYSNDNRKIYCARTRQEALLYQFKAVSEDKEPIVIDSTWAQAYYLKGYANIDLGKLDEAKIWINKALALSPSNSIYHSELGQVYQLEKKWSESITIFENALEPAYSASPEANKNIELLRAKRGIAYSLIELGKLEEAEQQLKECLTIDPNDEKSQHEIQYIKSLKSDNK